MPTKEAGGRLAANFVGHQGTHCGDEAVSCLACAQAVFHIDQIDEQRFAEISELVHIIGRQDRSRRREACDVGNELLWRVAGGDPRLTAVDVYKVCADNNAATPTASLAFGITLTISGLTVESSMSSSTWVWWGCVALPNALPG